MTNTAELKNLIARAEQHRATAKAFLKADDQERAAYNRDCAERLDTAIKALAGYPVAANNPNGRYSEDQAQPIASVDGRGEVRR